MSVGEVSVGRTKNRRNAQKVPRRGSGGGSCYNARPSLLSYTLLPSAGVFDALDQGISTVVAKQVAGSAGGGTCARVVVQLSQRLVLTRQAFEASLTLDNSGGSSELTNVTVQLIAWLKGNGTAAGSAFAVGQPSTEVRHLARWAIGCCSGVFLSTEPREGSR